MSIRRWLISAPCCLALGAAAAQGPSAGWRTSLSLTPVYIGGADIDGGGSYESQVLALNAGAVRPVTPRATAGFSVAYAYYDNRFDGDNAFAAAPWGNVERIGLSLPLFARTETGWAYFVTPSFDYFRERGAEWGESLTYGAVMSVARVLDPQSSLGLGVGVFQQLEEADVFPFVAVDWQLSDALRLNNPLPAGPTGPAGLELNYRATARWDIGLGAAWRSVRFRLRDDGASPGGVGEESGVIAFLHAAARLGGGLSLDLYGGALLDGELQVEDSHGDRLARHGFDTAPLLGATLRARF